MAVSEADSDYGDELQGRLGRVTVPIPESGPGEIVVSIRGGTERFTAYAEEPIAKHLPVVIVGVRSARSVDVAPFPEADTPVR
jgi:membrane protein implicated in regulation of membrane protease activity